MKDIGVRRPRGGGERWRGDCRAGRGRRSAGEARRGREWPWSRGRSFTAKGPRTGQFQLSGERRSVARLLERKRRVCQRVGGRRDALGQSCAHGDRTRECRGNYLAAHSNGLTQAAKLRATRCDVEKKQKRRTRFLLLAKFHENGQSESSLFRACGHSPSRTPGRARCCDRHQRRKA